MSPEKTGEMGGTRDSTDAVAPSHEAVHAPVCCLDSGDLISHVIRRSALLLNAIWTRFLLLLLLLFLCLTAETTHTMKAVYKMLSIQSLANIMFLKIVGHYYYI